MLTHDRLPVAPSVIMDQFENVMGLSDYQVTQVSVGRFLVKLRKGDGTPQREKVIEDFLRRTLGESTSVDFDSWELSDIPQRYREVVGPEPASSG